MKKRSAFLELKESERAYRRKIILEAATQLFSSHSFYEIGMRDIAEKAGISPASIYRYFSSRDDILAEILAAEASEAKKRQFKRIDSGRISLEDIARGIVNFFLERESTLQMIGHFLLNKEIDPEAREKFLRIQKHYLEEFSDFLRETGHVSEEDRLLFPKAFFAAILGVILSTKNTPHKRKNSDIELIYTRALLTARVFNIKQTRKKKMVSTPGH